MKTKLLKRIRRQFEIIHYPNGYVFYWLGSKQISYKDVGCVALKHKGFFIPDEDKYVWVFSLENYTVEQAVNEAKDIIVKLTRKKYAKKENNNKYKGVKLWYNG